MWRNILVKLDQNIIPQLIKFTKTKSKKQYPAIAHPSFFHVSAIKQNTSTEYIKETDINDNNNTIYIENDHPYIVPYNERGRTNLRELKEALKKTYSMNSEEIEKIMQDEWVIKTSKQSYLINALKILNTNDIRKQCVVDYPWILAMDIRRLNHKLDLLTNINGLKDINDFVAYLRLQLPRLNSIIHCLNKEHNYLPNSNRVYYLADKIQMDAYEINKYLAKRLFVLEIPWDMFKKNLDHMIQYKVEPANLLKDLWAFKYAPQAVENRLKRALQAKKNKIMPWMVRCPEPILQKSLQLTLAEQNVLDGKSKVAEYVAERLGFSVAEAQAIMNRHPQVNTVRVTKIKEVLDYLINEQGFTNLDIAQTPRILCHSLETTKQRLEELKRHGCRPSSLVIVCRSKKQYEKFLESWLEHNKIIKQNRDNEIPIEKTL